MRKPDFGSMLIVLIFAIAIAAIIYLAGINMMNSLANKDTGEVWYSKPTWPDPTPKPTPKPTEETTETSEEAEDDEDYEDEESEE